MKTGIYIELPSGMEGTLRLARCQNGRLEALTASGLNGIDRSYAVAFAPALSVARFRIPVAAKTESDARKVALYAIEDDLAQPVEDVHLTLGPKKAGEALRDIFVVDQALLRSWKDALIRLGLGHAAIVPEASLTFPPQSVLDLGDRMLINGTDGPIAADTAWPEEAIQELIQAAGIRTPQPSSGNALETLAALHTAHPGTALSGSEGGSRQNSSYSTHKRWRLAISLAGIALLLWIASIWTDTYRLNQTVAQQETSARNMFHLQFPDAPAPADIHTEVRRLSALQAAAPRTGFRTLTSALYQAISASDTIHLQTLSYSATEHALRARLRFANRADEAAFRTRLENAGWSAEVSDSADGSSGVDAGIILRAKL